MDAIDDARAARWPWDRAGMERYFEASDALVRLFEARTIPTQTQQRALWMAKRAAHNRPPPIAEE